MASLTSWAQAQDAVQTQAPTAQSQRVEIQATKVDERLISSITKIVVPQEDIVRYADRTLADVLRRLPSLTVANTESGTEVRMRGLAAGYTQLLLNGSPVPTGFSVDAIAPETIDRIEIIRSSSVELGAKGIAGTVNIVLKHAKARPLPPSIKLALGQEAGRPNASVTAHRIGAVTSDMSYALVATAVRSLSKVDTVVTDHSTSATGEITVDRSGERHRHDQIDALNVTPSLQWKANEADSVAIDAFLGARRIRGGTKETYQTTVGQPLQYESSGVDMRFDVTTAQSTATWKHEFGSGARVESKLRLSGERRRSDALLDGYTAAGGLALVRQVHSDAVEWTLEPTGKLFAPWSAGHDLEVGWEGSWARRTESRLQRDESPLGILPTDIDENYNSSIARVALFAQDDWTVNGDLQLYTGLRWEVIRTSTKGNTIVSLATTSSVVSPVLQAVWLVPGTHKHKLRSSLSRTYKAPAPTDIMPRRYVAKNNSPTTPDVEGNPELRPELSWGLDLAYEVPVGHKGLISVAAYARVIDDVIREELFQRNGTWIAHQINGGRADAQGIEFDFKVQASDLVGALPSSLWVTGNASRNTSRVRAISHPDNRLGAQVPFSANLGFVYQPRGPVWSYGATASYTQGALARLTEARSTGFGQTRSLEAFVARPLSTDAVLRMTIGNVLSAPDQTLTRFQDVSGVLEQKTSAPRHWLFKAALEVNL